MYYKDHTSVEYHIQNSSYDDTQLTINGKSFEKEKIDLIFGCFMAVMSIIMMVHIFNHIALIVDGKTVRPFMPALHSSALKPLFTCFDKGGGGNGTFLLSNPRVMRGKHGEYLDH